MFTQISITFSTGQPKIEEDGTVEVLGDHRGQTTEVYVETDFHPPRVVVMVNDLRSHGYGLSLEGDEPVATATLTIPLPTWDKLVAQVQGVRPKGLKCYLVRDTTNEDYQDLIWAESRSKAIAKSEAYQHRGKWQNCRARRIPWLDGEPRVLTREEAVHIWGLRVYQSEDY